MDYELGSDLLQLS